MRRWIVVCALACALAPRIAHADKATESEARRLFSDGNERLESGDYVGALDKFRTAYGLWANAKILLNIGTALRQLGRNAEAADAYEDYLAHQDSDPKRKAEVTGILKQLEALLGKLQISVNEPGARVIVDGKFVGESPQSILLRVEPGVHSVVAEKQGYAVAAVTVVVAAREGRDVDLKMIPIADGGGGRALPDQPTFEKKDDEVKAGPPVTYQTTRDEWFEDKWGWVLTAGGVVVLGVGAAFMISASSLEDQGKSETDPAKAKDLYDQSDSRRMIGGITLATGGAILIAGVVKLAWPADQRRVERRTRLEIGPGTIGLAGTF